MRPESRYHVGDEVRIIDVDKCAWGNNVHMKSLIGKIRRIRSVFWSGEKGIYYYKIENDNGDWTWDDSCLERPFPDNLPDIDTSGADLCYLLG